MIMKKLTVEKFKFYKNELADIFSINLKNNPFCLNIKEDNYHILNYQKEPCDLDEDNFECPKRLFCYKKHKHESLINLFHSNEKRIQDEIGLKDEIITKRREQIRYLYI